MKAKLTILFFLLAGLGWWGYNHFMAAEEISATGPQYNFAKIEQKDILNMVSATGTLSARELVEVGTQVSGTIAEVYKDFNHPVEAGELVALIDTSVLDAQVKSSEADLLRHQATFKRAQIEYERFKPLHDKGFLSGNDFLPYEIARQTAQANVLSAEASLERVKRNRAFAEIRAPISGVIINRNVERGQTVAASFNTPRLFIIAEDLALMEILANVDESDIGQIKKDQEARFTVAAYPDLNFVGRVVEIRLQPTVIQNVVNYTVVVETENPRNLLLPGMTATLDFVVDEVKDAFAVPASALNLKMSDEMLAVMQVRREEMRQRRQGAEGGRVRRGEGATEGAASPQSGRGGLGGGRFAQGEPSGGSEAGGRGRLAEARGIPFSGVGGLGGRGGPRNMATLWYMDEEGQLQLLPVRTGVSDGITSEIMPLRDEELPLELDIISQVLTPSLTQDTSAPRGGPGGDRGRGRGGLGRLGF